VTDANGNVLQLKSGPNHDDLAAIGGMWVYDRNPSGIISGVHSPTQALGWTGGDGPFGQTATATVPLSVQQQAPILEPRTDGIWDGYAVIQGVRVSDPQTGTWTTPDEFPGFIHDPMSQKSYVLDRNDPTDFEDETGLNPEDPREVMLEFGDLTTLEAARLRGSMNEEREEKLEEARGEAAEESNERGPVGFGRMTRANLPKDFKPAKGDTRETAKKVNRGNQYGYRDSDKNIWVPPPPGQRHGAPHWDVIDRFGNHTNRPAYVSGSSPGEPGVGISCCTKVVP
jgi:hypothetical protein